MNIAKLRRKINDSYIGQKVNGSIPGILVEGMSRNISDAVNIAENCALIGAGLLTAGRRPAAMFNAVTMAFDNSINHGIKDIDPNIHYSHRSPLYEMTTDDFGESRMKRVCVKDALLEKIAEYVPKNQATRTAALVADYTKHPEFKDNHKVQISGTEATPVIDPQ